MAKKYNKSFIKIKAWTNTDDIDEINGFDVETHANGDVNVILNALASVVAQVLVDNMSDIPEALKRFNESIVACIKEELKK